MEKQDRIYRIPKIERKNPWTGKRSASKYPLIKPSPDFSGVEYAYEELGMDSRVHCDSFIGREAIINSIMDLDESRKFFFDVHFIKYAKFQTASKVKLLYGVGKRWIIVFKINCQSNFIL